MIAPMDWFFERLIGAGSAPYLATCDRIYTYADLIEAIELAAKTARSAGIKSGDGVALVTDHSLAGIAWLLALARERTIVTPIATGVAEEIELRLKEVAGDWRVDFSDEGQATVSRGQTGAARSDPILQTLRDATRAGLILFSSGSSGRPKAMVHDFETLLDSYRTKRPRALTILLFLMFDHIGGLNTLLHALASGLCVAVPPSRNPEEVAALIASRRVNVLPATPTFLNLLLLSGAPARHDLSSLRVISYGTEPMPEALLGRLRAAFPKVRFIQTFGTSETGILQTTSESSSSTAMKLDDANTETRVVDGELWIRSKTQVLGYLNHGMDRFTEDGWFQTGDLVDVRADGFLRIVGRRTEVINVGGQKVLPGEVETVLLQMPEIADCTVYGEPNAITGQAVAAQVVLATGVGAADIKARMRAHCRGKLEAFKTPIRLRVVERTAFGERFKKSRGVTGSGR